MSDDLANNWGCNLCNLSSQDRRKYKPESTVLVLDEFRRVVTRDLQQQFTLQRVCEDGSTANLLSIIDATNGDTSTCLVAAGCYVSASTFLQNLSTSGFELTSSLAVVIKPELVKDTFARRQIVGLPYHISGCLGAKDLEKYEDECIRSLHTRLLLLRTIGNPVKCLLLELMLAGCGAMLSDRALSKLAWLSMKHSFSFIVDEIMTSGRTGTMLMLSKKPDDFIQRVSHVTLGKWTLAGIVLTPLKGSFSSEEKNKFQQPTPVSNMPRKPSTFIDVYPIQPVWSKVMEAKELAEVRREIVLKKLKCDEREAWGEGCLIFAPVRSNTTNGLKCRYLPQLELLNISMTTNSCRDRISKFFVDQTVREACVAWSSLDVYIGNNDDTAYYLKFIQSLCMQSIIDKNVFITYEEVHSGVLAELNNKGKVGEIMRKLESASLLQYVVVGRKRRRMWRITRDVYL